MKNAGGLLSVVTVTKDRPILLDKCLSSLRGQFYADDELVLIDNGTSSESHDVAMRYSSNIPIRYYKVSRRGYPALYNYGIQKCRNKFVVFFDDDCVADKHYIQAVRASCYKHPQCAIQGATYSTPKNNIYADIMGDHYQNWIQTNMLSDGRTMRTFDNKNLVIPMEILKKYGVFNEQLASGSEDIELGKRLRYNGVSILYSPDMLAYHQERTTLRGFLKQHARIAKSEAILDTNAQFGEKIRVISKNKLFLHALSAWRRENHYIMNGQLIHAFQLPCLYVLLAVLRTWIYYTTLWGRQKSA